VIKLRLDAPVGPAWIDDRLGHETDSNEQKSSQSETCCSGAIRRFAVSFHEIGREILLVTTRQTKRWIIPKGWPIKGLKPAKSAAREAYEEAGVRGSVKTKAIGIFSYEKGRPSKLSDKNRNRTGVEHLLRSPALV
jgi:8-oxo-dGTP pyrophosphatase MutT (NUDIX family)